MLTMRGENGFPAKAMSEKVIAAAPASGAPLPSGG